MLKQSLFFHSFVIIGKNNVLGYLYEACGVHTNERLCEPELLPVNCFT